MRGSTGAFTLSFHKFIMGTFGKKGMTRCSTCGGVCRPSRGGACRGQASRGTCTTRRSSGQHTSWFLIDWKDREEIRRERKNESVCVLRVYEREI